jgi:hypothetical protein
VIQRNVGASGPQLEQREESRHLGLQIVLRFDQPCIRCDGAAVLAEFWDAASLYTICFPLGTAFLIPLIRDAEDWELLVLGLHLGSIFILKALLDFVISGFDEEKLLSKERVFCTSVRAAKSVLRSSRRIKQITWIDLLELFGLFLFSITCSPRRVDFPIKSLHFHRVHSSIAIAELVSGWFHSNYLTNESASIRE